MIEILDCAQNSPEWYQHRSGIPTCSDYATLIAKGKGAAESVGRQKLVKVKAGELITGKPTDSFSNVHTDRGHTMEQEVCDLYAFMENVEPQVVGFVRNGQTGGSPDRFIGDNGILEIKTKLPHILIDVIKDDEFPSEHKAQCQGLLSVCEREWIDIVCYWPGMPFFKKRAYRDEAYIKTLNSAVDKFNEDVAKLVAELRAYGLAA